jgi:hypothetical protein
LVEELRLSHGHRQPGGLADDGFLGEGGAGDGPLRRFVGLFDAEKGG